MTAAELAAAIGRAALYRAGAIRFYVTILDARTAYGKTRYQIAPRLDGRITGYGSQWVDAASVRLQNKTKAGA